MTKRLFFFTLMALCAFVWLNQDPILAQDDGLPPLPAELAEADAAAGMAIYQARCATCHGVTGLGDGEMAAQSITPPLPIGTADYLATADLANMRQVILNGNMEIGMPPFGPGNSDPLDDTEITNILASLYDLAQANAPLPEASVRGRIINGTTGEPVIANLGVELSAFDSQFQQTLAVTSTLDAEGNFLFNLQDVSPTWAFIPSVVYGGVDFTGDVFQFQAQSPDQDVTVTVFDPTMDDANILVQQWHIVAEVIEGNLRLGEVFVFVNQGNEVYVGPTGDPEEGTVRIPLPAEAIDPTFRRGFGGSDSFLPANELMPIDMDWVDVFPLRPGLGGMIMLAQYSLPYEGSFTLERPVYYAVEALSIVVPQGVTINTDDGWEEGEAQNLTGQGNFVTYRYAAAEPGDTVTIRLSGEPDVVVTSGTGAAAVVRNENNELFIGVVALAVVAGGAFYLYRSRQNASDEDDEFEPALDKDGLLQAIADLDEAYEAGELSEGDYQAERQRLKALLLDIWDK